MDSDNRKTVDSYLAEIGAAVGKNIRLNENGISAFTYDHLTFVIEVPENVSTFFIYTTLGSIARYNSVEKAMKKLLQLNYLQQETRGGCLALDPMNDDVIFSYSDRIDEINPTEFRNVLENFIETALNLYKELEKVDNELPDQPSAPGQEMQMGAFGGMMQNQGMPLSTGPKIANVPESKPKKPDVKRPAGMTLDQQPPVVKRPAMPAPGGVQQQSARPAQQTLKKPSKPAAAGVAPTKPAKQTLSKPGVKKPGANIAGQQATNKSAKATAGKENVAPGTPVRGGAKPTEPKKREGLKPHNHATMP